MKVVDVFGNDTMTVVEVGGGEQEDGENPVSTQYRDSPGSGAGRRLSLLDRYAQSQAGGFLYLRLAT